MQMRTEPIRVGILGTGRIAVDTHVRAIREAGGEVAAFADISPGRAERFAARLGVPRHYETLEAMIAEGEIDAVDVCTPPVSHLPAVLTALDAGLPVYLEKPPAMNQSEMRRMAERSVETGIPLVAGTNQIFYPDIQAVRRMIDRGELGEIYLAECQKTIRRFYRKGWHRSKAIAGGGVVMDSSTHRMDLVLYLLSNPSALSVSARTFRHFAGREEPAGWNQTYLVMDVAEQGLSGHPEPAAAPVDIEDSVVAWFRMRQGLVLTVREMVGVNMPDETVIRLYGTKAGIVLRMAGTLSRTVSVYGEAADGTLLDSQPVLAGGVQNESTHTGAFRYFFRCIRGEEDPRPGLERAVNLMGMVDAIYASSDRDGLETPL